MIEQTRASIAVSEVSTTPLTEWKKEPSVRELKQDLADAKPIHDTQVAKINVWLDNLNVTGKAKVKVADGNSSIVPRLIRKQAEWRYAALSEPFLSTDDVFNVRPVTWEDREAAQQNELLLNHQINNVVDKVHFIDEYVRTAVDEGTVIIQVGWEFEDEPYEEEVDDIEFQIDPTMAPLHAQLAQLKEQSPSQYATDVPEELRDAHDLTIENGQPIRPVVKGRKWVTKRRVIKNGPTLEVCDFRNVVFDPTCMGDYEKAGFAVKSFESSLAELKKSGKKYKNLDRINIGTNSILGTPDHNGSEGSQTFNFSDEPRKKFVVYEYSGMRDIDGSGTVKAIVAAWVGDTMIRLEESPFPDKKIPFVVEQYLPVRKSNYGEPDGALLEDNQKVVGAVTRGMIDIMGKSANGQTGIRKDMLDATNRRKFDRGQDYEFNQNVDPRQGVYMHTYTEIPNSAQFMLQLQNMDAESLTGVKSWSQGVSGAALGDVASANRGALDAASKRELGILRRLSSGMVKIGRKMIAMNGEFLSDEEVVRITNDKFVKIRRDDLAGKFDLRLSISTAEEDNNRAERLEFMLQTVGPNADPEMGRMILSDIAKLRKMPDLAKKIENFQPQPDPLAQKMQELQIAKIEAEIAELRARAEKTLADAGLSTEKTNTEVAKQGHLKSDTDQKNLDFVEQESGVKQERDKELVGEQARSQGQLKVIDRDIQREKNEFDLLKEYVKGKKSNS